MAGVVLLWDRGGLCHDRGRICIFDENRDLSAYDRYESYDPRTGVLRVDGDRRYHRRWDLFRLSAAHTAIGQLVCRFVGRVCRDLCRLCRRGAVGGVERLSGAVPAVEGGSRHPLFYADDGGRKNVWRAVVFLARSGAVKNGIGIKVTVQPAPFAKTPSGVFSLLRS